MHRSTTMHLTVEPAAQDNASTVADAQVEATEATGEKGVAAPILWSTRFARLSYRVGRYAPLLLFFLIWEFVSRSDPTLTLLLPPPTKVLQAALELTARGELQEDTLASLKRVAVALILACGVGFPLGAALGASRTFQWFFEPIVSFFRPIPPLAWIPMSIVWLGIGDAQNEFIIFLGAFFPIVLNTMQGVRDVEKQFIRAAQTLGANRLSIAWTVILPSALSAMFIGLRVGLGIAWMALVAGELVAATSGLGFLISQGRLLFRTDYIVVGMVMIGVIGLLLDAGIVVIQRLVMPWQQK
jgi:ABC-type nitrate/sulfonate/bicarbonate transport system permease component